MKKLLVLTGLLAGFLIFTTKAYAAQTNPLKDLFDKVLKVIIINEKPLQVEVTNLPAQPSPTPTPAGKWIHVCFHVPNGSLYVMRGGTCDPDVHWRIFVQCYDDKPCKPDNPEDSYYVPPQEM